MLTDYLIPGSSCYLAVRCSRILLLATRNPRHAVPYLAAQRTLTQAQQRPTLRQRRTAAHTAATLSKPLCTGAFSRSRVLLSTPPRSLHRHGRTRHAVARGTRVRCAKHHAEQLHRCYRARTSGTLPYTDRGPARSCRRKLPHAMFERNAARSVPHLRSAQVFPGALRGRCRKIPAPAPCSGSRHGSADNARAGAAGHHP